MLAVRSKSTAGGKRSNEARGAAETESSRGELLVVTNLVTDMIMGTSYIQKEIEKIIFKKTTLKPTGSRPVATKENVDNDARFENSAGTKKENPSVDYSSCPCTVISQQATSPMDEACLFVKSNVWVVRLVKSHVKLVKCLHAFVAYGIVEEVPTRPFLIKMKTCQANRSKY